MFHIKVSLFARTKSLENKIDLFHDKIIDAAMTFKKAIRVFLNEKRSENYRKLSKQIKTIEHDADALRRQLDAAGCPQRAELPFHKLLLDGTLPLTMGGGIGQSRLCMLLLGSAHIGEVQASVWDAATREACAKAGIPLL